MKRQAPGLMLLVAAAPVVASDWLMTDASELTFEAYWEETALPGRFKTIDVRLDMADGGIAGAVLVVDVDLVDADMDDPDINEAIAGDEWFAVAEYPVATFSSSEIVATGGDAYLARGRLDLKGRSVEVDVPFSWSQASERATMTGSLTLDRRDFGIGSGEWAEDESIGKDVRVEFRVVFERR